MAKLAGIALSVLLLSLIVFPGSFVIKPVNAEVGNCINDPPYPDRTKSGDMITINNISVIILGNDYGVGSVAFSVYANGQEVASTTGQVDGPIAQSGPVSFTLHEEGQYAITISCEHSSGSVTDSQFTNYVTVEGSGSSNNGGNSPPDIECSPDYPYLWSDGTCWNVTESDHLPNGCHVDTPYSWSDGKCYAQYECTADYPFRWSDGKCYDQPEECVADYPFRWSDGKCYDQPECTVDYPYRLSNGMCSNQSACKEGYVYVESLDACALIISEAEKRIKEYKEGIITELTDSEKSELTDSVKSEPSLGNLGKIISKKGNVEVTKIDGSSIVNSNGITEASILKTGNEANTNIKIQSDNGGTINLGPNTFFGLMLVSLKDIDPKDIPEERRKALASFLVGMYLIEVSQQVEKDWYEILLKRYQEERENPDSVHYILKDGKFHRDVSEQEKKKQESVITPQAIITSKNTDYEVIVTDDTTRLNVLHGVVEVIALDENGETMVVNTGESLIISTTQFKKTQFDINSMNKWWEELAEEAMAQEETMMEKEMTESESMEKEGGGCLIATATYGSELAPQVQQLRELRDNSLLQTESGISFMNTFNDFYYSFSPTIADWERESPVFKEMVKVAITPMLSTLSIMTLADSEAEVLGLGISVIALNLGMYFVAPVVVIHTIRKKF